MIKVNIPVFELPNVNSYLLEMERGFHKKKFAKDLMQSCKIKEDKR